MTKPKYLYHGGAKKLKGNKLIPKKAKDLGKDPDNSQNGIYASSIKEEAIAMGLTSCKGVKSSSLTVGKGKIDTVIYEGWPKQDHFYLYTLPSKTFEEKPAGSYQYVSKEAVKPEKIQKLEVKKYIKLIRKASEKEKREWLKPLNNKGRRGY